MFLHCMHIYLILFLILMLKIFLIKKCFILIKKRNIIRKLDEDYNWVLLFEIYIEQLIEIADNDEVMYTEINIFIILSFYQV